LSCSRLDFSGKQLAADRVQAVSMNFSACLPPPGAQGQTDTKERLTNRVKLNERSSTQTAMMPLRLFINRILHVAAAEMSQTGVYHTLKSINLWLLKAKFHYAI